MKLVQSGDKKPTGRVEDTKKYILLNGLTVYVTCQASQAQVIWILAAGKREHSCKHKTFATTNSTRNTYQQSITYIQRGIQS